MNENQQKIIAGALVDFLRFLCSQTEPVTIGDGCDALIPRELLAVWADARGLSLEGADVDGWSLPHSIFPVVDPVTGQVAE